jgi:short-subunit dehydrogenase
VARTGLGLKVNRLPRARPEAVAEAALRGLEKGRLRVFPVAGDRIVAALVRFLPGALVRSAAASLYRER